MSSSGASPGPAAEAFRRLVKRLLLPLAAALAGCASVTAAPAVEADYLIENVRLVPMTSERVIAGKAVAIKDGRIAAVLDRRQARRLRVQQRIDAGGRYLMPGLGDMHVHTRADPETSFKLHLANGVTTIRNLNDRDGGFDHVRLRADVAAGTLRGPRYFIAGPYLDGNSLKSVADVEPLLERYVANGYDFVKIHGDLPDEIFRAVMDGAKQRNLLVTGHVQRQRPLPHSLGMYSIEHAEEFLHAPGREALKDPGQSAVAAQQLLKAGLYVVPTLVIFNVIPSYLDEAAFARLQADPLVRFLPPAARESWLSREKNFYRKKNPGGDYRLSIELMRTDAKLMSAFVKTLNEAGVPLVLGTDIFGALVPGFAVHQELQLLVEAGLTPFEALRTGTVNVAAYLRESDSAGTIEPGKRADLVLVAGNPLLDIKNAADVRGVFTSGRWLPEEKLKAMLAEVPAGFADPKKTYVRAPAQ